MINIVRLTKSLILKIFLRLGYRIHSLKKNKGIMNITNSGHYILSSLKDMSVGEIIREDKEYSISEVKKFKKICSFFQNENNKKTPRATGRSKKKSVSGRLGNLLYMGANIGYLVLEYANSFDHIYALEADPENFFYLENNILINKKKNIQAFNLLANDNNNNITFLSDVTYAAGSKRFPKIKNSLFFKNNPIHLKLKGAVLDNYF